MKKRCKWTEEGFEINRKNFLFIWVDLNHQSILTTLFDKHSNQD